MTITDIDKQFSSKFEGLKDEYPETFKEILSYIHQIYTQAKAEQRENDALIVERRKIRTGTVGCWPNFRVILPPKNKNEIKLREAYNESCDSIASEIRGQHD